MIHVILVSNCIELNVVLVNHMLVYTSAFMCVQYVCVCLCDETWWKARNEVIRGHVGTQDIQYTGCIGVYVAPLCVCGGMCLRERACRI